MKLLYILIGDVKSASGVYNKIVGQITELNKIGVEAEALIFAYSNSKNYLDSNNVKFISLDEANRSKSNYEFIEISKFIDTQKFDYLYIRYSNASKELLEFCRKYSNKIIFEHNAMEAEEFASTIKSLNRKDLFYAVRHPIANEYLYNYRRLASEKKYSSQVLQLVKFGVCVTDEIAEFQKKKYKEYKTVTIPNGINVNEFQERVPPVYDGKNLNMVLISGHENNWHGVDRLLIGMAAYEGSVKIKLKLIGLFQTEVKKQVEKLKLEESVVFLPILNRKELDQEIMDCHLGIGHLAFFRKKLNQGAVLKVREYLARGIPYVISHKEVDVESIPEFSPFYLKVSHNEEPINVDLLVNFIEKVYEIENFSNKIRELAIKYIDIEVKMKDLRDSILR
jgi:hypothetical protein